MKAHTKILFGLVSGIALGALAKAPGADWLQQAIVAVEPFGTVFIRLITMVVVPLVVSGLFVGVASLGDVRRLGRIGGRTLGYFAITTLLAAMIGTILALGAHLGSGLDPAVRDSLTVRFQERGAGAVAEAAQAPTIVQMLVALVPQNPFAAAAAGELLPLIVAVCIFGAAATVVQGDTRKNVVDFFQGVNELAMVIVGWMMRLAPAAVLILVAATVARSGIDLLKSLLLYTLIVVLALFVHVALVLLPILRLGARLEIVPFFRAVSDAVLLAFSTASSSATLPVSMAAARSKLGVSNEVVAFVLPAGSSMNKNGAAVYKAVTAVFLAQLYGVALGPAQLATIVVTSTLAAFAGAGVPGSSLVTTLIVLNAIGLGPHAAAGIALVVGVDRPLDMCRSAVNTFGNLIGTAYVARREGEELRA
ncbi:MAG: dicarboxylate/amino acid:cation symporter [Gemmatimonadaceae bacterium]